MNRVGQSLFRNATPAHDMVNVEGVEFPWEIVRAGAGDLHQVLVNVLSLLLKYGRDICRGTCGNRDQQHLQRRRRRFPIPFYVNSYGVSARRCTDEKFVTGISNRRFIIDFGHNILALGCRQNRVNISIVKIRLKKTPAANNVWYKKCFKFRQGQLWPDAFYKSEIFKMKRFSNAFWSFAVIGVVLLGVSASADAQARNQREVRDLVRTLTAQVDDFQYGLDYELKNNSAGTRANTGDINRSLRNLQDKITHFDENFLARRENRDDANEIITSANDVEASLVTITLNRRLQADWADVKKTITALSANYGVVAKFDGRISNATQGTNYDRLPANLNSGLSGTYSLDAGRSENIADILSGTGVSSTNRTDLESKLEAPEQIALDVRGNQVTLASSKASPVTVTADGTEKIERSNGRTVRLKATLRGDELTVSSLGGETDYTIIFTSQDGGRSMKVTRRITTDYLSETVFAESIYTKTEAVAGLGIDPGTPSTGGYSSNDPVDRNTGSTQPNPTISQGRTGEFLVPNGAILTANLDNLIDTKVSQNNDRFKLTVQSPNEFRGAVIEGYLSGVGRSGQVSGRSNITFNFESITLRNGQRYDFAGTLQGIKDQYGKVVKVDSEGTAKSDSQTRETAKRGGAGAGLGALIGAIAGGGKGAVIGAIIGGGAGAGSVIATGREDIKLTEGSTLTIQSSSPVRGTDRVSEN